MLLEQKKIGTKREVLNGKAAKTKTGMKQKDFTADGKSKKKSALGKVAFRNNPAMLLYKQAKDEVCVGRTDLHDLFVKKSPILKDIAARYKELKQDVNSRPSSRRTGLKTFRALSSRRKTTGTKSKKTKKNKKRK